MSFIRQLPSIDRFPLVLSKQALRRGYPTTRSLMSKESEASFRHLALLNPQAARGILKQLTALGNKVKTVVFPAVLAEAQNREIARTLAVDHALISRLVDEQGVLDLRKVGLKMKMPVIDRIISFRPQTIEDYLVVLGNANADLQGEYELGDLFLFKAVLRARLDLYIAGENRSAMLRRGEKPGVTPELQRIKDFLDQVIERFPFGTNPQRQAIKEKLTIASLMIGRKNNVAADTTLTGIFYFIEKIVTRRVVERTRLKPRVIKLTYAGKGNWNLGTTGYRSTVAGFKQKTKTESNVHASELLSMIQHVIDSVRKERATNEQFLADLWELKRILPDNYGRLLEIFETFQSYDALRKDKACAELAGVVQLVPIGTEQSLNLAKELVGMAGRDIELRQIEISAHEKRFVDLITETETELAKRTADFIALLVKQLSDQGILSDPDKANKAANRAGSFLGTFLKGELREPWLRRIKSRFAGLVRVLRQLRVETERKKHFMEQVVGQRNLYFLLREELRWAKISTTQKRIRLAELKATTIENVKADLAVIDRIDREVAAKLRKAAEFIMLAELDFRNRNGEEVSQKAFLTEKTPILAAFDYLLNDRVAAISHDGQLLGQIGRNDALKMELEYRPLR